MSDCYCKTAKIDDYKCEVIDIRVLADNLFWLTIKCPELAERAAPGHSVMVFPSKNIDPLLGRPFAVADADPERGEISICVLIAGRGTKLLSQRRPGEKINIRGLIGVELPIGERVYMAAGGVGAAIFTFYNKLHNGDVAGFYLGIPGRGYELFAAKMRELAPNLQIFTDDGSFGDGDSMFKVMPRKLSAGETAWACGPIGFFQAVERHFTASPDKLWLLPESRMACGYGGCMGCVVETKEGLQRVCVDRSLFRADEVTLDEH